MRNSAGADGGQTLEAKWGKRLVESGWTALPNAIFYNQKALKLKHMDMDILVLMHLASYWRSASDPPRPSKATIAASLDVAPRTVQRSIEKMEKLGYVQRISRKAKDNPQHNLPNAYDLSGLGKAPVLVALVDEELERRRESTEQSVRRAKEVKAKRETPNAHALANKRPLKD